MTEAIIIKRNSHDNNLTPKDGLIEVILSAP